jgi:hypothetical protein
MPFLVWRTKGTGTPKGDPVKRREDKNIIICIQAVQFGVFSKKNKRMRT